MILIQKMFKGRESPMQTSFTWMQLYFPPANWKLPLNRVCLAVEISGAGELVCVTSRCTPPRGETAMQPPRYYDYFFLNPLRRVKGYSGRDLSSARSSAQVWRWNNINGHVERRPQVHRGACVRIKSGLLQILPRNVVAIHFILSPVSHFLGSSERIGWFPHPSVILSP